MQLRERVEKPRSTVCFQWSVAPEGREVGPLHYTILHHTTPHSMTQHYTTPHSTTTTATTTTTTLHYTTRHYTNATRRQYATWQRITLITTTAMAVKERRASGRRPVLPNVVCPPSSFETHGCQSSSKTCPPPSLETSSCQGSKRVASPHSNSMAVKDGTGFRATAFTA